VCVCVCVCACMCRVTLLTWQESWPPFSCPAHRKISGMNSCRPARRNMDLQQSLLTMGTDTCACYSSLLHQFNIGTYNCWNILCICVRVVCNKRHGLYAMTVRNCLSAHFLSNTKNCLSPLAILWVQAPVVFVQECCTCIYQTFCTLTNTN
jgi:hypothetical protein